MSDFATSAMGRTTMQMWVSWLQEELTKEKRTRYTRTSVAPYRWNTVPSCAGRRLWNCGPRRRFVHEARLAVPVTKGIVWLTGYCKALPMGNGLQSASL